MSTDQNEQTREQEIPASILQFCDRAASHWNFDLSKDSDLNKIAQKVLQLSDYFIQNPEGSTPWHEEWAQIAYAFYFLPLNSARVRSVLGQIQPWLGFLQIDQVVDFGAGLATASRQLREVISADYILIEQAAQPHRLVDRLDDGANQFQWQTKAPEKSQIKGKNTLTCFSYSLTELQELPSWAQESQALLIIEPSTQDDGRKLLQLREKLLQQSYTVLAPCTHQRPCPLLNQSKTDWCHDRLHLQMPEWMQRLENFLPMKNRTLTMSYLFMVKAKAKPAEVSPTKQARIVGDLLKEKGKDRQVICRGPDREFLAWLHKNGPHEIYPRGILIDLPENLQKVSNELRFPAALKTT